MQQASGGGGDGGVAGKLGLGFQADFLLLWHMCVRGNQTTRNCLTWDLSCLGNGEKVVVVVVDILKETASDLIIRFGQEDSFQIRNCTHPVEETSPSMPGWEGPRWPPGTELAWAFLYVLLLN